MQSTENSHGAAVDSSAVAGQNAVHQIEGVARCQVDGAATVGAGIAAAGQLAGMVNAVSIGIGGAVFYIEGDTGILGGGENTLVRLGLNGMAVQAQVQVLATGLLAAQVQVGGQVTVALCLGKLGVVGDGGVQLVAVIVTCHELATHIADALACVGQPITAPLRRCAGDAGDIGGVIGGFCIRTQTDLGAALQGLICRKFQLAHEATGVTDINIRRAFGGSIAADVGIAAYHHSSERQNGAAALGIAGTLRLVAGDAATQDNGAAGLIGTGICHENGSTTAGRVIGDLATVHVEIATGCGAVALVQIDRAVTGGGSGVAADLTAVEYKGTSLLYTDGRAVLVSRSAGDLARLLCTIGNGQPCATGYDQDLTTGSAGDIMAMQAQRHLGIVFILHRCGGDALGQVVMAGFGRKCIHTGPFHRLGLTVFASSIQGSFLTALAMDMGGFFCKGPGGQAGKHQNQRHQHG